MSCFIYAKTCDPPIDFWRYYTNTTNSNDVIECSIDDISCGIISEKVGNGFFLNIGGKIYVVTCFHAIGHNNVKVTSSYFDKEKNALITINLTLKYVIEEFDIAIFETEKNFGFESVYNACEDYRMSKKKQIGECIIKSYVLNGDLIQKISMNTIYDETENIKFVIKNMPGYEIPFINLKTKETSNNLNNFPGLSGSIVFSGDKPLGIVMLLDTQTKIIHAMPFNIVIEIVKAYIQQGPRELRMLILNSDLVYDEEEGIINYYGHLVTENFGISYQTNNVIPDTTRVPLGRTGKAYAQFAKQNLKDSRSEQSRREDSIFTFEENDIIISINNNVVNEKGYIVCDRLGYEFKLKAYVMLEFIFNDYIEVKIMRDSKIISCKIMGVNPEMYLSCNLRKQKTFLYYEDFIFMELSQQMLEYLRSKNMLLINNEISIINTKTKQKKHVVFVCVNHDTLRKNNIAFENNKLAILDKVGKDEVVNLEMLKNILNKQVKKNSVTYSYV